MITLAILSILAQQATGTVSGRVTDSLTHQPVRGALLTTTDGRVAGCERRRWQIHHYGSGRSRGATGMFSAIPMAARQIQRIYRTVTVKKRRRESTAPPGASA
jgi:hypothetical protein